ncbi:MAG: hypothetical protein ACJ790_11970 [Myxococcaceae bacterium]
MAALPAKPLSPPFASRELNGEILLEELNDLRDARIGPQPLVDCALAVRALKSARVTDAALKLKQLAGSRFQGQPALAALLIRWAAKLKSESDVTALVDHLERLALTSSLLSAMRRQGGTP